MTPQEKLVVSAIGAAIADEDAQRWREFSATIKWPHLLARVLYVPGVMAAVSRRELLRIGLYIHCLPAWAAEVKP